MFRPTPFKTTFAVGAFALLLAGCQTTPKQTVLDLDTTDPLWPTEACVKARKTVYGYDDRETVRAAAGVAGTVAGGPIAGATAGLALNALLDGKRGELNEEVKAACITKKGRRNATMAQTPPPLDMPPAPPPPPSLGEPVATPSQTAIAEPAPLPVPDATQTATPASTTEPQP